MKVVSPSIDSVLPINVEIAPAQTGERRLLRLPRCRAVSFEGLTTFRARRSLLPGAQTSCETLSIRPKSYRIKRIRRLMRARGRNSARRRSAFSDISFARKISTFYSWLVLELARRTLWSTVRRGQRWCDTADRQAQICDHTDQLDSSIISPECIGDPARSNHI